MFKFIHETILVVLKYINEISQGNDMMAGVITAGVVGVLSLVGIRWPRQFMNWIIRQSTTTLHIASSHQAYHSLCKYLEEDLSYASKLRSVRLGNGRYGRGEVIKYIGYGRHLLIYGGSIIQLSHKEKPSDGTEMDKNSITFRKFGRSHAAFDKLVEDATYDPEKGNTTLVKSWNDRMFISCHKGPKRDFDSIFLAKDVEDTLVKRLDLYADSIDWCKEHKVTHQLGILLYGPPGTGKTSIARAIAGYLDRSIANVPASKLTTLPEAVTKVFAADMILVEDIDTSRHTNKRSDTSKEDGFGNDGLAGILNAIDGVTNEDGRVFLATTNNKDDLDPAILRKGRMDLVIEIGYVDLYAVTKCMNYFYPDNGCDISQCKLKSDKLTGAELHAVIEERLPVHEFINRLLD